MPGLRRLKQLFALCILRFDLAVLSNCSVCCMMHCVYLGLHSRLPLPSRFLFFYYAKITNYAQIGLFILSNHQITWHSSMTQQTVQNSPALYCSLLAWFYIVSWLWYHLGDCVWASQKVDDSTPVQRLSMYVIACTYTYTYYVRNVPKRMACYILNSHFK